MVSGDPLDIKMAQALLMAAVVLSAAIVFAQGSHADVVEFVAPPVEATHLEDPVTRLARRMMAGQTTLAFDARLGMLPAVLRELHIPVSSQVLVFSKTSLQHQHITPQTPRALYFNDDVYVGFVPDGGLVELSAVDPNVGAVFYTLPQAPGSRLRLVSNVDCVQCHLTPATLGIPGHLLRSVFVGADGQMAPRVRSFLTDHRSPIEERWGGWYVTGRLAGNTHMGNAFLRFGQDEASFDRTTGTAMTNVANRFRSERYLAAESDVVALMVLDHQVRMHNLLARLHYTADRGLPVADQVEELLRYTLFVDEAPLNGLVAGTTTFAADFERIGPKDAQGRSLRDLDLRTRLFRYPCSYLIYSEAFRGLPAAVKLEVYSRLAAILSGRDTSPTFAPITQADRTAIAGILTATAPEFAAAMR